MTSLAPRAPFLIIDIVNADQFPGRINETLPLIRGYLTEQGLAHRCLRFGFSTENQRLYASDAITFSEDELSLILRVASDLRPGTVLTSDEIAPVQKSAILEAIPGDPRPAADKNATFHNLRSREFANSTRLSRVLTLKAASRNSHTACSQNISCVEACFIMQTQLS